MNDRFKFRIWWKKENRYRVDTHIIPIGHLTDFANSDKYVVEQCTGLKDKNGNLIYEGDLIKAANYKTGLPEIYVVKWCDECGLYQLESTQSDQIIDMFRAEKGTIVGNIHEQAEQKDVK